MQQRNVTHSTVSIMASGYAIPGSDIGSKFLNVQQVTVSAAHKLCLYHIFYSFREQIFQIYKKRTVHSENHRFKINQKALGYRLRTVTCTISESGSDNAT